MAGLLKREALKAFKNLHRARLTVFKGDDRILLDSRQKINEEFRKNKLISDQNSIQEMIEHANAVAKELRSIVVQAIEHKPGVYRLNVTPDTELLENKPFDPDVEVPNKGKRSKQVTPCSQNDSTPCCQQTTPCCREISKNSQAKTISMN